MSEFVPKRPQGNTPFIRFCQWVFDEIFASRIINSSTVRVSRRTKNGTSLEVKQESPAASPASITQYRVKTERKDYLVCRTYDATSGEGATDVYIAKPQTLRNRLTQTSITQLGRVLTITPATVNTRTVLYATLNKTYTEHVWLPYVSDSSIIYAVETGEATGLTAVENDGSAITSVDLNVDARRWLKVEEVCVDNVARSKLIDGSEAY